MNTETFTAEAKAAGYAEFYEREFNAAPMDGEHTHDFDARVMVTAGAITLTIEGERKVYQPGDWCEVLAGTVHEEEVGTGGVTLYVAKR